MNRLLAFGLTLAFVIPGLADTIPTLIIKTDAAEQHISLADINKVNYSETEMYISMRNGDKQTFVIDEIKGMKFAEIDDSAVPNRIVAGTEVKFPTRGFRLDGIRKMSDDKSKGIIIIKTDKDTRKVIK